MTAREFVYAALAPEHKGRLLTMLTPPSVEGRSPLVRVLATGGMLAALSAGLLCALSAAALLLSALYALHFLLTKVLGIEVRFSNERVDDPVPVRSAPLPN